MRVKALKDYYYDRRQYITGDIIEVDDRQEVEVNILVTLGTLEKLPEEPKRVKPAQIFETRDLKAEESKKEEERPRQRYRRRDLRAEP